MKFLTSLKAGTYTPGVSTLAVEWIEIPTGI